MAAVGRPTIRTDESIRTAVIDELKWDLMSHCGERRRGHVNRLWT
jgi:hypothetical protein